MKYLPSKQARVPVYKFFLKELKRNKRESKIKSKR
jgi:hypothetical protein